MITVREDQQLEYCPEIEKLFLTQTQEITRNSLFIDKGDWFGSRRNE